MITLNDWPDGAVAHVQWVNRAKWVMVRGTAANSWDHPAPTFGLPPGTITIRPDPRFEQWALEHSEKFAAQAELLSLRAIDAMNERDAALAQVAELTAERDGLAKDAARYRWLRDCHNDSANVVCVMHDFQLIEDAIGMDRPELLNLDFCVDAMVQQ